MMTRTHTSSAVDSTAFFSWKWSWLRRRGPATAESKARVASTRAAAENNIVSYVAGSWYIYVYIVVRERLSTRQEVLETRAQARTVRFEDWK